MLRPLMQHGVGQLEALLANSKANLKVLKQLEHELQFRQVPRALALLEKVQAAIPAAVTAPAPVTDVAPPVKQPELWPQPPAVQLMASPPSAQQPSAQLAAPVSRPATVVTPRSGPSMSFGDACKVLKVAPTSPWQDVEMARRNLVQLSHPGRLASMTPEQRNQLRMEAKRVNSAFAVLSAARLR